MRKKGSLILGILLLVIGLVFIFYQPIMGYFISNMSKATIKQQDISLAMKNPDASFDFQQVDDLNVKDVVQAQFNQKKINAIGAISVPQVNMRLPILYGVSNTNLAIGAGTMKPEQKMGKANYALAGHNMNNGKALFSPLTNAKEGMRVYVTDFKKIYEYKIDKMHIVQPEQIDVIDDSKEKMITLVTCNYDGSKRLIIQGILVEIKSYDKTSANNIFANK